MNPSEHYPPGYVSTLQVRRYQYGKEANVIGLVIDVLAPRATKNDWQMTFQIADAARTTLPIKVSYFRPDRNDLPDKIKVGSVVALQSVKVNEYRGVKGLLGNQNTEFVVFEKSIDSGKLTIKSKSQGFAQQEGLLDCAERLKDGTLSSKPDDHAPTALAAKLNRKMAMIKDTQVNKFYDLTCEVIKIFNASSGYMDLHVTDYTKHPNLQDYAPQDSSGYQLRPWEGPYGRRTLKVEVHEPHATWCRTNDVDRGSFIRLRNVRIKMSHEAAFMEGNLFPDRLYPDRVLASLVTPDEAEVQKLMGRKVAYISQCKAKGWNNTTPWTEKLPKKRPVEDQDSGDDSGERAPAQNPKQKRRRKQALTGDKVVKDHASKASNYEKRQASPYIKIIPPAADMRLSSLHEVVHNPSRQIAIPSAHDSKKVPVPFVNVKHKIKVKVIDFYPHEVRAFTEKRPQEAGGEPKWMWNFVLRVVPVDKNDACKEGIDVEVSGTHATKFLQDLPPGDLSKEGFYQRFRTKLDVLCKDVVQRKDESWADSGRNPSTWRDPMDWEQSTTGKPPLCKPVELCIREEGFRILSFGEGDKRDLEAMQGDQQLKHPTWGWKRVWRLCDTVISDGNDDED